jgi:hypothetical protein
MLILGLFGALFILSLPGLAAAAPAMHSESLGIEPNGETSGQLGFSLAPAGDVNGDGLDDVACGAPLWDNGETNEGGVFLYYGRADGDLDGPVILEMNDEDAWFGRSVSWAGDVNGDGYDEVPAGAPRWGGFGTPFYVPVQGAARMYYGAAGTPTTFWSRSGG